MALMDSFELVSQDHDKPFITLRNRSITFSKRAITDLHETPFVHMYIDRKGRRAAFVPCGEDENAIPFYSKPKEGRSVLVRFSDKEKAALLMELAGIKDCGKGIRYYGKYVIEEDMFLIDFSSQQKTE